MPELPELEALAEGLTRELAGARVEAVRVTQPALVRSAAPPVAALGGRALDRVWRRGKLLGLAFPGEPDLTLVLHLMQAGRVALVPRGHGGRSRAIALRLELEGDRDLVVREAAREHRAGAHLLDPGGLAAHRPLTALGPEPVGLDASGWRAALTAPPAQVQTALRDGRRVAGIGRGYGSDILWAARIAPLQRTDRLDEDAWGRLARAADAVLTQALSRARAEISTTLPNVESRVHLVHGHAGRPCPRCGETLARVSYAGYELVYCPACQTGGRRYADRRMSRLLR
jgi:formamidopyrimidine-DNA glycosylase